MMPRALPSHGCRDFKLSPDCIMAFITATYTLVVCIMSLDVNGKKVPQVPGK